MSGKITIALPSGAVTQVNRGKTNTDWYSIRHLYEGGVPTKEIAQLYKVKWTTIRDRASKDQWISPGKTAKMASDLRDIQIRQLKQSGAIHDLSAAKAKVWESRAEDIKERLYDIASNAIDSVTPDQAGRLIKGGKSLVEVMDVAMTVTGEKSRQEAASGPRLGIAIGLLGGNNQPIPVEDVDAIDVTASSETLRSL